MISRSNLVFGQNAHGTVLVALSHTRACVLRADRLWRGEVQTRSTPNRLTPPEAIVWRRSGRRRIPTVVCSGKTLLLLGASTCAITPWPRAVQGRLGAVPWISLSSRQQPARQSLLAGSITTCSGGSTWVISTALCRNIGQFPVSSVAVG